MIIGDLNEIRLAGVAAALPTRKVRSVDYYPVFGAEMVDKIVATTGIRESYHVHSDQTAGDLAFAAARHLLKELKVEPSSIGLLIFVVTYPDYFVPSTANILQKRLGLPLDCLVFDMNLACSGFIIGLQAAGALLKNLGASRALLLVGDSTSKVVAPGDKSRLLFGDAGSAALLETAPGAAPMNFGFRNDGGRFKSLIVPAGAFRLPEAPKEPEVWADGNSRSDYNLFMNGADVFSFAMTDGPALILEFLNHHQRDMGGFEAAVFHQPNAFIMKHIARKINLPPEKMPLSLDRYGNTSGASIPVTLCDAFSGQAGRRREFLFCAFGAGLSWAVASVTLDEEAVIPPLIHTDEFHQDGLVPHQ
jgi:3-oxoacyl-[acyl-carrier-protein] synthase-3